MERQNLQKHVRTLITLPVADAPVISCYQALAAGRLADRNAFDGRMRSLRRSLHVTEQHAFDLGLSKQTVTGGTARLGVTNDRLRLTPGIFALNPQDRASAELSYTQPLLRGGGIDAGGQPWGAHRPASPPG